MTHTILQFAKFTVGNGHFYPPRILFVQSGVHAYNSIAILKENISSLLNETQTEPVCSSTETS